MPGGVAGVSPIMETPYADFLVTAFQFFRFSCSDISFFLYPQSGRLITVAHRNPVMALELWQHAKCTQSNKTSIT